MHWCAAASRGDGDLLVEARVTWTLIRLWKGRFEDLQRAKRNGGVYEEILEELQRCGIVKRKDQVHHKIENLTKTY